MSFSDSCDLKSGTYSACGSTVYNKPDKNNLGGVGPNTGTNKLQYKNIGVRNGAYFHLRR